MKRKRINQELNYPKRKKQKIIGEFMVVRDNPNVGHVMGVEELSELENPSDVEGVLDGSSFLELPVDIPSMVVDNPLIHYLQVRDFVEDTIDDFKIEAAILLDVQVEHVVEIDVTTESGMIPASNEIHVDVNVNECQLGFVK
ncbi:hypothetical protein LIER_28447 [Lithospermum erythrorhizon]|uniref:Uncharacterized protein n=1 Tax=Lithospermum erythrorhizon TaxID=34254 RepID=A0AAV3RHB3_LITER